MEKFITIDNISVRYTETGVPDGVPVIILHGWGCRLETVASITKILEKGMHVFTLDLPGHGESDEPSDTWGVYEYTGLIEKFASELGIKSPVLVGHSYGGRISIVFASRNDVRKVMLVDSAGIKPRRSLKYHLKVRSFKLMKAFAPLILGRTKADRLIEKRRAKAGSADYAAASPVMRRVLSKSVNQDLKHLMPSIKAPVLLVWGENDTATPLSDAKKMEKLIPDAGLVSFPGCGHYSFLDNPGGFRAVTLEFLKNEINQK